MLNADQIFSHLVGDYLLQSHWMSQYKTRMWRVALIHATTYSVPFVIFLRPSVMAWVVIVGTHAVIDRYRLARFVVWAKNQVAPKAHRPRWAESKKTGYGPEVPDYLALWLLIIADNILHLAINAGALKYL